MGSIALCSDIGPLAPSLVRSLRGLEFPSLLRAMLENASLVGWVSCIDYRFESLPVLIDRVLYHTHSLWDTPVSVEW